MTQSRQWRWALIAVATAIILLSTVRDQDWLPLLAFIAFLVVGALLFELARTRGYEFQRSRSGGAAMVAVMIIVFVGSAYVVKSTNVALVLAGVGVLAAMIALGLRRKPSE
jgi:hypothetical protein